MYGSKWITLTLAALSTLTLAAPTKSHRQSLPDGALSTSVSKRPHHIVHPHSKRQDPLDIAADIISIVDGILDIVSSIDDAQHEQEGAFTQQTVDSLRSQYPTWNVLVFHDQDSTYDLYNAYHEHFELELVDGLGTTKGYEVWVFQDGWFQLAGDGGYENWCYSGDYANGDDDYVEFYSMM